MNKNILITYASKYGATKEIAGKIGEVLCQEGLQADVLPVDGIRDVDSYTAIILGSAVYVGKWPKEAVQFLKTNEKKLANRPVWIFSSGPTGEGDPVALVEGQRLSADVQAIADRIHPRDVTVFHGFIDPDKLNRMERWTIKSLVKKPFGDFRNWEAIATWATGIANVLKSTEFSL